MMESNVLSQVEESRHMNKLSNAELERLIFLSGNLAKVITAISKIILHGYDSVNPKTVNVLNNRSQLEKELGGMYSSLAPLFMASDIKPTNIEPYEKGHNRHIVKYLHYQSELQFDVNKIIEQHVISREINGIVYYWTGIRRFRSSEDNNQTYTWSQNIEHAKTYSNNEAATGAIVAIKELMGEEPVEFQINKII